MKIRFTKTFEVSDDERKAIAWFIDARKKDREVRKATYAEVSAYFYSRSASVDLTQLLQSFFAELSKSFEHKAQELDKVKE